MLDRHPLAYPQSGQRMAMLALLLLAFSLPFELVTPWLSAGFLQFTNVELLLIAALLLAAISLWREGRLLTSPVPPAWRWLWLLVAVMVVLAALLAPALQLNALKAASRTLMGLSLAWLVPHIVGNRRQVAALALALVASGVISAALGLLEIMSGRTFASLDLFRLALTTVGPYARLSGTFHHANQAAMYIEATLPILVVGAWWLWQRGRRALALIAVGFILFYLQASLLTYSRASFATILITSLIVAAFRWWAQPLEVRRQAFVWAGLAGVIVLLMGLHAAFNEVTRLRLSSEGDNEWYDARLEAPERLKLDAGTSMPVTLTVANDGLLTWSSDGQEPVRLSGIWYVADDGQRLSDEMRWPLPRRIAPDEEVTFSVDVRAPERAGNYRLEWDLVQENVTFFSHKNGKVVSSLVEVNDVAVPPSAAAPMAEESLVTVEVIPQPVPDRWTLWQAAAIQLQERPLLGIGLDNFRLTHGHVFGWERWNTNIHSNNWYIETLVSLGLLGAAPFFIWLLLLGWEIARSLRHPDSEPLTIGLAAGLLAFAIHGLLDYFLLFNATGLLFWFLVGLWISQRAQATGNHSSSIPRPAFFVL